jgi:hypothetical protein
MISCPDILNDVIEEVEEYEFIWVLWLEIGC